MYYRQIEAVNATVPPRSTLKKMCVHEKENTGIRFNGRAINCAIRHTMTEQQQQAAAAAATTTAVQQHKIQQQRQQHSVCMITYQIYTSHSIRHQVLEVLGCETTRCQTKKKRRKVTALLQCIREYSRDRTLDSRCSVSESFLLNHSISYGLVSD